MKKEIFTTIVCSYLTLGLVTCKNDEAEPQNFDNEEIDDSFFRMEIMGHGWKYTGADSEEREEDKKFMGEDGRTDFYLTETEMKKFGSRIGCQGIFFLNTYNYIYKNEKNRTVTIQTVRGKEEYKFLRYNIEKEELTIEHTVCNDSKSSVAQKFPKLHFRRMTENELQQTFNEYESGPYKLISDENGKPVAKGMTILSSEDFQKYLVGCGWKYVEGHIILPDMTIDLRNLNIVGWGPSEFYIGKDNATKFVYVDSFPLFFHHTDIYTYANNVFTIDNDGFTILSYDESTQTLVVIDNVYGVQYGVRYHYLEFYQRMTEEELAKTWEVYAHKLYE